MDNSGPAFPAPDYVVDGARLDRDGYQRLGATRGVSRRELAAMFAMAGMVANAWICGNTSLTPEQYASDAVLYADALLAELSKADGNG